MKEILLLAESDCADPSLFWRIVKEEALKKCPEVKEGETSIRPLSDHAGVKFGREVLGFGTWTDCTYEHVYLQDPDYLDWLADKGMVLLKWLKWRKARR